MKFFLSILLTLSLQNAHADAYDCRRVLSGNFSTDSRHYALEAALWDEAEFGKDHMKGAISVIRELLKRNGCERSDINFGVGPNGRSKSRCVEVSPAHPTSLSCYVESNLGYFFLTKDMLTKIHVVFSRWD